MCPKALQGRGSITISCALEEVGWFWWFQEGLELFGKQGSLMADPQKKKLGYAF